MTRPWPGRPAPLGTTWDGEGTNVGLFSPGAERVEVCLFDDAPGGGTVETRVALEESTHHVWHGYLPQVGPGQRYGFRVDGPFAPAQGLRFNPHKLLVDPYARAVEGTMTLDPAVFGSAPGSEWLPDGRDSAPFVPRSVVVHDAFPWGDDRRPGTAWSDTVVYELHVRGFTARHPDVPPQLRGTYAGLGHPAAVEHLVSLGVTAVELMPVHHFVSEPHLLRAGLTNYWGYNSLGYFAPHAGYSASGSRGEQVREFKAMVRSLHAAGIEVLLDVVYNHTAEGDETGPTLAFRGIDNPSYYRLEHDRSRYRDYTGCGNTLDARNPHVLQLLMDSLRYWVTEMHVDGFRFDLASALARSFHDVDKLSGFFDVIHQDPVVNQVKLVAEPWDVGEGGYQVGEFPPLWTEWNGKYRDTVRRVWSGSESGVRELAYRLSGSSDLYQDDGRRPSASINFVTSHDGFTLRDLTTYETKRNEANGEGNRDGDSHNGGWNCGVEGETDDAAVQALRRRQARNHLAVLLLSTGVPMLSMGDEVRRTQQGNNNAYCQDTELSYQPWEHDAAGRDLREWVRFLVRLRRTHPVFRQNAFFSGRVVRDEVVKDLAWFGPDGAEVTGGAWFTPGAPTLGMYLDGRGIRARGPRGEAVVDDSFLLLVHAGASDVRFVLPSLPWAARYGVALDTAGERPAAGNDYGPGALLPMVARSVVLLQADRPLERPRGRR
ncbi:MAG: glycogen debranching protein GlgX [Actinomycetota bacterium]|nr:glycogen debranching protein GlgX [Actinomycetota bacterium]